LLARRSCIKLPMLLPGSYVHEGTNGPIMGELPDIFRMGAIRYTTFGAAFKAANKKVPDAGGSKQASATCASPLVRFLPAAQAAGWSNQGETLSGVLTLML